MTMPDIHRPPTPRRPLLRRLLGLPMAQDGGPPDLDEMWRDFTRKLSNALGFGRKGGEPGNGGGFQPDARNAGIGVLVVVAIAVVVWLFSGSFVVQEGQRSVVTTFGRYTRTVGAGWGWRWPWPIQANETVDFTQVKTVEVGGPSVSAATGLRDSSMLTRDEDIVDVRFNVQYDLKDARQYLEKVKDPNAVVTQAAESAVREIVGRSAIDDVLGPQHDALGAELARAIQAQLDRLETGVQVTSVNVEAVSVPDQVSAAFGDVQKAGADRETMKNEGQAYANEVIGSARGDGDKLRQAALAYKARVVDAAQGDADRFKAIQAEYAKAPGVTRDRMYIDAMSEVYSNVTKVLVDTRGGSSNIQLPLDKLVQAATANAAANANAAAAAQAAQSTPPAATAAVGTPANGTATDTGAVSTPAIDPRARDTSRSRDRDRDTR